LYWKNWGKANQVWIDPISERAATSYFFCSSSRVSGLRGLPRVSGRSMVSVPRSSRSQSLKTSRTIMVFAPGSAT
jgi:hypothetical protein